MNSSKTLKSLKKNFSLLSQNQQKNIKSLLGLGSPLIDISANTNIETLNQYGLEFGRTVLADDQKRPFFEILEKSKDVRYIPGGSVCNSIRVTNWILQNRQKKDNYLINNNEYKCAMLGCVGRDENGQRIINLLNDNNIQTLLEIHDSKISGRCAVGIFNKERCLMPEINASADLSEKFIDSMLNEINSHDCLLIEGYYVDEKGTPIVRKLVQNFEERQKSIIITLSATFIINLHYEKILEISNKSDIIFCNKEEAECFVKIPNNSLYEKKENNNKTNDTDYEKIEDIAFEMHKILNKYKETQKEIKIIKDRLIIITCGKDPVVGSLYKSQKEEIEFFVDAPQNISNDDIIDTNGCGDSFVGGFMAKYLEGENIQDCLKAGNWASSIIIKNIGCSFPEKCEY